MLWSYCSSEQSCASVSVWVGFQWSGYFCVEADWDPSVISPLNVFVGICHVTFIKHPCGHLASLLSSHIFQYCHSTSFITVTLALLFTNGHIHRSRSFPFQLYSFLLLFIYLSFIFCAEVLDFNNIFLTSSFFPLYAAVTFSTFSLQSTMSTEWSPLLLTNFSTGQF